MEIGMTLKLTMECNVTRQRYSDRRRATYRVDTWCDTLDICKGQLVDISDNSPPRHLTLSGFHLHPL